uniref:Flocculation protein FLO11-like n=1 Tax=Rhabditophanes sp. KR3021 TaxID=114890 RepID=A0AC35U7U1_9BILA
MTNVATAPSQNQRSSVTRTKEIKNGATLTSSIPKNYAAAKFDMTSNQPDPALVSNTSSVVDEVFESKNIEAAHHETKPGPSGLMKIKVSPGNENHVAPSSSHIIVNEVGAIPKSSVIANEFNSPYSGHIIPAQVEKEVPFSLSVVQEQYFDTEVVTNTIYTDDHNTTDIITNTNTMIIKPPEADTLSDKNKILSFSIESPKSSFNRPRISVLKNVSAISLDDFWKNP